MTFDDALVCSCPGKVLLSGGYLVLDRQYTGLVAATSARFYAVLTEPARKTAPTSMAFTIQIISPQFQDAAWDFELCYRSDRWILRKSAPYNSFIDESILATVNFVSGMYGPEQLHRRAASGCRIYMIGDNEFYSQETAHDLHLDQPIINKLNIPLKQVHKTGLGSSAAMVTSLIAALSSWLLPKGITVYRPILHNLAQYAHSVGQGKIGSGFDISSAVYGTHVYKRFDPMCLKPLMDVFKPAATDSAEVAPPALLHSVLASSIWNSHGATVSPFALPPLTTLMLADVDAGAHTPTMVSSVLRWRQAHPDEADRLWEHIGALNDQLAGLYAELGRWHARKPADYARAVEIAAGCVVGEWKAAVPWADGVAFGPDAILQLFAQTARVLRRIRRLMKEMGELARVDIEPDLQTAVLDRCSGLPGVLGGGVPGAGGLDAAWVLVVAPPATPQQVTAQVEGVWSSWQALKVSSLLQQGSEVETQRGLIETTVGQVPLLARTLQAWALT